jgi:hypothetical protein
MDHLVCIAVAAEGCYWALSNVTNDSQQTRREIQGVAQKVVLDQGGGQICTLTTRLTIYQAAVFFRQESGFQESGCRIFA